MHLTYIVNEGKHYHGLRLGVDITLDISNTVNHMPEDFKALKYTTS